MTNATTDKCNANSDGYGRGVQCEKPQGHDDVEANGGNGDDILVHQAHIGDDPLADADGDYCWLNCADCGSYCENRDTGWQCVNPKCFMGERIA